MHLRLEIFNKRVGYLPLVQPSLYPLGRGAAATEDSAETRSVCIKPVYEAENITPPSEVQKLNAYIIYLLINEIFLKLNLQDINTPVAYSMNENLIQQIKYLYMY